MYNEKLEFKIFILFEIQDIHTIASQKAREKKFKK